MSRWSFLFLIPGGREGSIQADLPWQIEVDGQGGSRVFGLQPGVSTLAQVKQKLGNEVEVAIIAEPNEAGTLGGLLRQVRSASFRPCHRHGRRAWKERLSPCGTGPHMESTTRKITLHPDDLAVVNDLPIKAVSVIPTVNLDEATVIQRFGQPGERLVVSEKRVHLLYPEKGLDVVVDADGKELLQYVAPRDFAMRVRRLSRPATAGRLRSEAGAWSPSLLKSPFFN